MLESPLSGSFLLGRARFAELIPSSRGDFFGARSRRAQNSARPSLRSWIGSWKQGLLQFTAASAPSSARASRRFSFLFSSLFSSFCLFVSFSFSSSLIFSPSAPDFWQLPPEWTPRLQVLLFPQSSRQRWTRDQGTTMNGAYMGFFRGPPLETWDGFPVGFPLKTRKTPEPESKRRKTATRIPSNTTKPSEHAPSQKK